MMIIQPINLIFKNNFTVYENTVLHNTFNEYEKSNSGIYIDFSNNLVKFKNYDRNKYCWLQFPLLTMNQLDEFYIEYEIRKCKGEPLKITIEKEHIYRKNAYNNTKTEWEKHCNKIIIEHDENGNSRALIGFGNTSNIDFECEIRNIKIKLLSTKVDNYINSETSKKSILKRTLKDVVASNEGNRKCYYIGFVENSIDEWFNFVFFHFSSEVLDLHNISTYNGKINYSITHLGNSTEVKHFKCYKKTTGKKVEFYIENLRNVQLNETFAFPCNHFSKIEFPLQKIESIPLDAEEIIPTEHITTTKNSINELGTSYISEKMKQEGVYNDYISYMDEKTVYDKQQRKIKEQRQIAYQEMLKENPNLTYEQFMSVQPMTLNLVEEPQPSKALKQFMEKYL